VGHATVIALDSATTDPDVSGAFAGKGHNVIGVAGGTGFVASDQTGVSAVWLETVTA
jgi:hypothetical protein